MIKLLMQSLPPALESVQKEVPMPLLLVLMGLLLPLGPVLVPMMWLAAVAALGR